MSDSVRDLLEKLRVTDEPQLSAFASDPEGQNVVLRNLPCALIVREAEDGVIIEVNDHALDIFGLSRASLLGKTPKSAGVSIVFGDSKHTLPGKPTEGYVVDVDGASIPVTLLINSARIGGRKVDIILAIDATSVSGAKKGSRETANLFRRVLHESKVPYVYAAMVGGVLERDLEVIESGGELPDKIAQEVRAGVSISDMYSPLDAAKIVETAIYLLKNGGEKIIEFKDCRTIKMFTDSRDRVLITFPPESEQRRKIRAKSQSLSSGLKRTVLYIASDSASRSSGKEMLEMLGFHVTDMESPASAQILFDENPGRFHFVVCEDFTDNHDFHVLAESLDSAGVGLVVVTNNETTLRDDMNAVVIADPPSINTLAAAVSEVTA